MKYPANKMTSAFMSEATKDAARRRDQTLEYARELSTDARADERKAAGLCPMCFYRAKFNARIGGAACTTKPCMCCHQDMHFGSTLTDALCSACAIDNDLCKRCGADMDLHVRATWPSPKSTDTQIAHDR